MLTIKEMTAAELATTHKIKESLFISDVISIGANEGYKYSSETRTWCFGTRVGPHHSVSDGLLHEIAHVAEVKSLDRMLINNFGLEIKTSIIVLGHEYKEPITWNATKLEARTIIWQEVLCDHFGIPFNREEFVASLKYMADFLNVPLESKEIDFKLQDNSRIKTICNYMASEKSKGTYTIDRFKDRWNTAIKYLENQYYGRF